MFQPLLIIALMLQLANQPVSPSVKVSHHIVKCGITYYLGTINKIL